LTIIAHDSRGTKAWQERKRHRENNKTLKPNKREDREEKIIRGEGITAAGIDEKARVNKGERRQRADRRSLTERSGPG